MGPLNRLRRKNSQRKNRLGKAPRKNKGNPCTDKKDKLGPTRPNLETFPFEPPRLPLHWQSGVHIRWSSGNFGIVCVANETLHAVKSRFSRFAKRVHGRSLDESDVTQDLF